VRSLDEVIGRTDLLEQVRFGEDSRTYMLDLSYLLGDPDPEGVLPRRRMQPRNDRGDTPLDDTILRDAEPALEDGRPVRLS
jgi:glutamate synthase (NADPH/NADH) large chain